MTEYGLRVGRIPVALNVGTFLAVGFQCCCTECFVCAVKNETFRQEMSFQVRKALKRKVTNLFYFAIRSKISSNVRRQPVESTKSYVPHT